MNPASKLLNLIAVLKETPSSREKLQALAGIGRTLRNLNPEERRRLALGFGLSKGEKLLEKIAADSGLEPAAASQALLDLIQGIDAEAAAQLRFLLKIARRPPELGSKRTVFPIAEASSAEPGAASTSAGLETISPIDRTTEPGAIKIDVTPPAPPARPALIKARVEPSAPEPSIPFSNSKSGAEETLDQHNSSREKGPAAPLFAPEPPAHTGQVDLGILPKPGTSSRPGDLPVLAQALASKHPAETAAAPQHPGPASDGRACLIRRFQQLREQFFEPRDRDFFEVKRVVESFPPGWARRRALLSILRMGHPRQFSDLLLVLQEFARAGIDYAWLVGTMVESRNLNPSQWEKILELAPSRQLHRRISMRLERR